MKKLCRIICNAYIRMYIKRLKAGYIPTKEDSKRFIFCVKYLLEV